jgi:hypothetical protein
MFLERQNTDRKDLHGLSVIIRWISVIRVLFLALRREKKKEYNTGKDKGGGLCRRRKIPGKG